ncbi:MAG: DUF4091 domain-containing protein [Lentisphaeria bacterium]|jgi:hypothetical protein|nr:DUF4091 domain-containing protein [Lentisphaeria bacterium]MDP7741946.1 DUF4091 domain-containing protein [Lentisphaeria bacterium]
MRIRTIALLCCVVTFPGTARATNLSVGKPYWLGPKPAYQHCTDEGDLTQLTDGQVYTGKGKEIGESLWTRKGTVGWHHAPAAMIVIDLQRRCRIDRIAYHTVGGGHADVHYPGKSEFFVSENGVDYTLVKTVTPEDEGLVQVPRHMKMYTFTADKVGRTGRYVMLLLSPSEWTYMFTDEVFVDGELLADQAESAPPPDAAFDVARLYLERLTRTIDVGAPLARLVIDRRTHMRANLRRVEKAVAAALPAGAGMTPAQAGAHGALTAQIDALAGSLGDDPGEAQWRTFVTTTMAMYAQAKALPLAGRGYVVWAKDMWVPLRPWDMPAADTPTLETVRVRAAGNEYESACVTLSNVSAIPLVLRVEPPMLFDVASGVTSAPVGPYVDWVRGPVAPQVAGGPGGWVTLRQVAFAETGAGMHGDALPELGEASLFRVPPMSTGQLWLTISTANVPAGNYVATLRMKPVRTAVFEESRVRVDLEVLDTRLTGTPPIRTTGWAYPRFSEIVGHDRAAVKDQLDHYMNAFDVEIWLCGTEGVYGPDGAVIETRSYEKLDRYLDLYKDGELLLIYTSGASGLSVKDADGTKSVLVGEDSWDAAFKAWYGGVVKHLLARGLAYDDFAFFPIDEPWSVERGKIYIRMVKLAKEVDAQVKTFVTAPGVPLERLRTWAPYTDIFCLGGPGEDDKARALIAEGSEVWFYSGAANKSHEPIGVARRNFWKAFHLGLKGQGVWDYCCSGWQKTGDETAWTELDTGGRADASMIYRGKHGPVTSKRWEAWRDGVEDYWLLDILRDAHKAGRTDVDAATLAADVVTRPGPAAKQPDIDPLKMALHADTDQRDRARVLGGREALLEAISKLK